MKAEFELNVDEYGNTVIYIRHHDKSNELEQRLLGFFIKNALIGGITMVRAGGYLESGTTNSWENYKIVLNNN